MAVSGAARASTGHAVEMALSEIKKEELPAPGAGDAPSEDADTPAVTVPAPEPIIPGAGAPAEEEPASEDPGAEEPDADESGPDGAQGADPARPNVDPNAPVPAVEYDLSKLPAPVRDLHSKLVAAAKAGLIEAVRPLLKAGEDPTQLSLAGTDNDPITFLKSLSGDEGGQEILAILLEVLEAGYVHLSPGTPEELYVWPYFFAVPLDKLTDMQRVELFKLVTSGDYEDMKIVRRLYFLPRRHFARRPVAILPRGGVTLFQRRFLKLDGLALRRRDDFALPHDAPAAHESADRPALHFLAVIGRPFGA